MARDLPVVNLIAILFVLFSKPERVLPGTRVSQVIYGSVKRSDGVDVAHLADGVLVDWARGGQTVVPAGALAFIA